MCIPPRRAVRRTDGMADCTAASESVAVVRSLRRRTERRDHSRLHDLVAAFRELRRRAARNFRRRIDSSEGARRRFRDLLAAFRNLRRRSQCLEDGDSRVHVLRIRSRHGDDVDADGGRHDPDHSPRE